MATSEVKDFISDSEMADFISDEDMAAAESTGGGGAGPAAPEFITDEQMAALEPQQESTARQLLRGTINTVVPVGAGMAAGALATPESFGVATIPAAAAGYAGGKQLARVLTNYILGDDIGAKDLLGMAGQTGRDFAEGAMMEAGGQIAGKVIGKGAEAVSNRLSKYANSQAAKQIGAGEVQFRDPEATQAIGAHALENKLIGPYKSAEESLAMTEKAREAAGQRMGEVFNVVDDKLGPTISPLDTAVKVEKDLGPVYRTPINKSEVTQLENTLESIIARGEQNITLKEAQSLKKEIDQVAYPKGKRPPDPTPKQQMAMDASKIVADEIEAAAQAGADKIGNVELVQKLLDARRDFGLNRQTERLLEKQVGKEGAGVGQKINWTIDPFALGASAARKFGPNKAATKAIVADKASKAITGTPKAVSLVAREAAPRAGVSAGASRLVDQFADRKAKGPEKWANDGLEKLEKQNGASLDREALMANPKARELLIQASDFKPGSKGLDNILSKIKVMSAREAD